MQVRIYKDAATVAKAAAVVFADEITKKDGCVIGLATGSTPVPTYQEMIRMNKEGILDFSKVRSFNLDEYIGLSPEHVCSYRRFMNEQLFDHINIDKANTHVPDGLKCNTAEYEEMIHQAGGVDLQLLGIGTDGHIGFNEPADEFVYPTNVVKLTEGTRKDNARFFNSLDEVPTSAISMGIGTIMSARRILMIITGKNKADTVVAALKGPVVPQMPASILRMHQNVLVLLDEDAASKL